MAKVKKNFKIPVLDVDGKTLDVGESKDCNLAEMAKFGILLETKRTQDFTGEQKLERHILAVKLRDYNNSDEEFIELSIEELKMIEDSFGDAFNSRWGGAALDLLNKVD